MLGWLSWAADRASCPTRARPAGAQAGLAQPFGRHVAVELFVAGAVDGGHPPAADLRVEAVAIMDQASRAQAHRLGGQTGLTAAGVSHTFAGRGRRDRSPRSDARTGCPRRSALCDA